MMGFPSQIHTSSTIKSIDQQFISLSDPNLPTTRTKEKHLKHKKKNRRKERKEEANGCIKKAAENQQPSEKEAPNLLHQSKRYNKRMENDDNTEWIEPDLSTNEHDALLAHGPGNRSVDQRTRWRKDTKVGNSHPTNTSAIASTHIQNQ